MKKTDILNSLSYTEKEKIDEVEATLSMEGMQLDKNDIKILQDILGGNLSTEEARNRILNLA